MFVSYTENSVASGSVFCKGRLSAHAKRPTLSQSGAESEKPLALQEPFSHLHYLHPVRHLVQFFTHARVCARSVLSA